MKLTLRRGLPVITSAVVEIVLRNGCSEYSGKLWPSLPTVKLHVLVMQLL